jgi:Na+/H+ antiporter NhaD/arsenite permease-like protein
LQGYCNASKFDLPLVLSISGFASAIIGDIPFAAALNPVISGLSHMRRLNLPTLAQALALGTDIGGDATLIGVSTNVVEASWLSIQE